MSKIKLSILLLVSFLFFSCAANQNNNLNQKYSVAYIGGEFDGLLLKNYLISSLKNLDVYDQKSKYKIKASIGHDTNLFITNIDNTSDREKISTNLNIRITNIVLNCEIYYDEINVSQFYIYASSDKFLSNQKAVKKIKKENTEATIRQFINNLKNVDDKCDE